MQPESRAQPGAGWVVADTTTRRLLPAAVIWAAVFALVVLARVSEFASQFPTPELRAELAQSLASNPGIAVITGPPRQVDTVGGYTALVLVILTLAGAVWGLFAATRLLRGEEDAGRWELYLAGLTTRRGATFQALVGMGVGLVVLWVLSAVLIAVVGATAQPGFSVASSLFFAAALVAGPAMFLAVGALASQFAATRRRANLLGAGFLGVSFLIRALADSGTGFDAIRWASPFGWVQQLQPLTESRPLPFAPIAALIVVAAAAAVWLAGRRDLGAALTPGSETSPPNMRLLGGQLRLSLRLTLPTVVSWAAGLAVFGFAFGLIAQTVGEAFAGSEGFQELTGRLGAERSGAEAYLGVSFLLGAALISLAAAAHTAATRSEEAEGYLDHLLARPVGRRRWLAGRLVAGLTIVVPAGLIVGLSAWAGAATQGSNLDLGRLVLAGLNIVAPAVLVLGVGGLTYGIWPRLAAPLVYTVVAWSVIVQFLGAITATNRWILNTSVLSHLAPAPATDPASTPIAWLVALGLLSALTGIEAFAHRDLSGD